MSNCEIHSVNPSPLEEFDYWHATSFHFIFLMPMYYIPDVIFDDYRFHGHIFFYSCVCAQNSSRNFERSDAILDTGLLLREGVHFYLSAFSSEETI